MAEGDVESVEVELVHTEAGMLCERIDKILEGHIENNLRRDLFFKANRDLLNARAFLRSAMMNLADIEKKGLTQ